MNLLRQAAALAALCVVLLGAQTAQAQYLESLKIGDPTKLAVAAFGTPDHVGAYKDYKQARWTLKNGNDYSLTAINNDDLTITYMELDWGGKPEGDDAQLFDFVFGQTTLVDIRKKLGSNGMAFKRRGPAMNVADGVIMLNSYEVGDAMVTFYCLIHSDDKDKALAAKNDDVAFASYAKLVGVSLASAAYAESDWGEKILDPAYKKVAP